MLKKQASSTKRVWPTDVKFYLEFFQYGCPPHGGFGLGIDRLTMLLCGLTIKDAEFLFRGPNRLTHLPRDRRTHRRRYLHWGGGSGAQRQVHLYQALYGAAGAARHRPGGDARERARDELPQSAAGRTIMTTEPKFIPETAVPLQLEGGGGECRVRLIDCVGYMVEGAMGHEENESPGWSKARGSTKRSPSTLPPRQEPAR